MISVSWKPGTVAENVHSITTPIDAVTKRGGEPSLKQGQNKALKWVTMKPVFLITGQDAWLLLTGSAPVWIRLGDNCGSQVVSCAAVSGCGCAKLVLCRILNCIVNREISWMCSCHVLWYLDLLVMLTEKKVINTLGWENRCAICPGYMFSENREEVYVWKTLCDKVWKRREVRVELGYLRSPPALSAGPHMENQASGPLGTDVCSPRLLPVSHGGCAGTWMAHSRHPTATSHSHLEQRETTLLIGWKTNKRMARKSTQSPVLTRPTWSKHITSAKPRSLGATVTVYTCLFNPDTHLYFSYRPVCT